ncbi:hypothetical protein V6N13_028586 [Hibiscus sabdariffa]|uniref:Uncharacterized protein n=2 Tax=Hibiscus sabdariffa TaxID=183260 RepID=A0ABR2ATX8_9ROSI
MVIPVGESLAVNGALNANHNPLITSWSRPNPGCVKIIIDGAVNPNDNYVAIGGVFWPKHCNWLFGFARSIGKCLMVSTELWVILDNLKKTYYLIFNYSKQVTSLTMPMEE